MPSRGILRKLPYACLIWLATGASGDDSAAKRPYVYPDDFVWRPTPTRQQAANAASQPADGAVQQAMQRLFVVPRRAGGDAGSPPAAATDANPGVPTEDEIREAIPSAGRAGRGPYSGQLGPPRWNGPYFGALPGPRALGAPRRSRDYRFFGGTPGLFGYSNAGFGFGGPGFGGLGFGGAGNGFGALAYSPFGFTEDDFYWDRFYVESNARTQANLQHSSIQIDRGLRQFKASQYREAADTFRLAAETNKGDPAARLYAAHALFAIGRYQEAVAYIRRAFDLQPNLLYLTFDIRDDYGRRSEFDQQLAALEGAVAQAPGNLDRLIMLGYVRYYGGQRERAFEPLLTVNRANPRDRLAGELLRNARPPDVELDRRASRNQPVKNY